MADLLKYETTKTAVSCLKRLLDTLTVFFMFVYYFVFYLTAQLSSHLRQTDLYVKFIKYMFVIIYKLNL